AHNKCLWEGTQYMVTPEKNSERWSMEYSQVLQRNAWLEDTQTMEDTHRAIESGRRKYLHLQDDEILIRHGYKVVQDWIDGKIELG
ncbi:MAG: SRPBCC family protein, partial [Alphaproteobacteria bacterium]